MVRKILLPFLTALATSGAMASAQGITAEDVLKKMSKDERFGYISGIMDANLYLEQPVFGGTKERSTCIFTWFYGVKGGETPKGPAAILAIFEAYRDKPAVGLIKILIDRECGKRN